MIRVTDSIKLIIRGENNPLPVVDLFVLRDWIGGRFPQYRDSFKMFLFANEEGKKELFISTNSKLANILLYYVLHHSGEKMIFKNPKNF
mgnify:CR=1 FL=1